MKIAVVRNRNNEGIIYHFGLPSPERYGKRSVQGVMDSLRACGHTVKALEGDTSLFSRLGKFLGTNGNGSRPSGMVFNMSYGIQGECRYTHVPMMMELAGVPYTGASPLGHAVCLDKVITKKVVREAGIPTPNFCTMSGPGQPTNGLQFPLVVKPRHESSSNGLKLVYTRSELEEAVAAIVDTYKQDALIEEYIDGRELAVGLLGNDPVQALPIVELSFEGRTDRLMRREDKFHKSTDEPRKICPAEIDPALTEKIQEISRVVFRECHCRDYARVDMRLDWSGNPYVLEINSMATLGRGGGYVMSSQVAGYTFESLIGHIVDVAHMRYFGTPAPRDLVAESVEDVEQTKDESPVIDFPRQEQARGRVQPTWDIGDERSGLRKEAAP